MEPGAGEAALALGTPAPHPVRVRASLPFTLGREGLVRLTIHDVLGREVAMLIDGVRSTGRHAAALDASPLAPGIYVARLAAGGQSVTARVSIVR
jgi:hypothetical protein